MIGYLRGTAVDASTILTPGGVGYEVACVSEPRAGDDVELWVHTTARENAVTLYGFDSTAQRSAFRALISVNGVGPASAISLVRDVGAAAVAAAIRDSQPKALTAASGVGAKLAERIVALCKVDDSWAGAGPAEVGLHDELSSALVAMGYDADAAREAVDAAIEAQGGDADESSVMAAALVSLRKTA